MLTVAVVGAGMAGLTCGRMLQTAGYEVTWFEK
ncbi:MAG: NAD(P)-binding protein, partial [Cyanobacteria bacterium J06626_26]